MVEKCLHILPMNKLSGAEKMALLICKNMKRFTPIVVCGGNDLKEIFEKNGIKSYSLRFSNKKIISTLNGLKNIIKENDIKILHAHDNNASLNAYLVKKLYRLDVKVISHIHSCYPFIKKNGINKKIDSFFRQRYDFNIACGKFVYDFYKENTNYFNIEKTKILSNAIDINEILNFDLSKSDTLKEEFNIPSNKIVLGFIGRLCEIKGIIPFIKEFSKYKEEFNDCKVLIVGSGNQEDDVKRIIKELELEELFILTGFQSNVYKFYPIIDIFFLPSLYEGLPMVLLEAMAFKKTIVTMNVGSISEIVIDEQTGFLVENELGKFINKIKVSKGNKNLRINLGNRAFDYVNEKYNIVNYVSKIEEIYNNIR
ncbi:glycosyltransferase [Clostridium perfringens]|uniref:glycosyltransferase n=1 Tax=Clostridium perfringens TaxID=1502 RepID=UPI0018E41F86|nr:glycosyltransferase [Clostridium perfringens]MBI6080525.1 glycosyltransferase [Clostridium perfringens]MBI6086045.1 glycosyltransferase [Clostridium perfringens]MBI6100213.1 glycosyltransferase [Clostridium perfringens]